MVKKKQWEDLKIENLKIMVKYRTYRWLLLCNVVARRDTTMQKPRHTTMEPLQCRREPRAMSLLKLPRRCKASRAIARNIKQLQTTSNLSTFQCSCKPNAMSLLKLQRCSRTSYAIAYNLSTFQLFQPFNL